MKRILFSVFITLIFVGCSHKTSGQVENITGIEDTSVVTGYPLTSNDPVAKDTPEKKISVIQGLKPVGVLPNATIFRMSGDYENNVGITLSPEGVLTYFPDPSDLTADSEPIELVDGWWLNCQGIGPGSVFTKYTFAQYAALPKTPSPSQLKLEIIPGAKVTEFREIPYKLQDVLKNPEIVKEYIKNL